MFVPSFKILRHVVPEKSLKENFVKKKEKWTNKGTDKQYVADTVINSNKFVIPDVCTKFQNPKSSSS